MAACRDASALKRALFAAFGAAAIYSVTACVVEALPMLPFLRALPTLLLVAAAALWSRPDYGWRVALGLFCGAWGDYFLASASRDWFLAGLGAFLLGHVFYIAAFAFRRRVTGPRLAVTAATAATVAVLTILVALRLAAAGETRLVLPVTAYSLVIVAMAGAAMLHETTTPLVAAGALVFVLSDAHIAVNHLLRDSPLLALSVSGYATYYLGQGLIAAGAVSGSHSWGARAGRSDFAQR